MTTTVMSTDSHETLIGAPLSEHRQVREGLAECVRLIWSGPWTLIQLRGTPLDHTSIDGDDIDLLGTHEQFMLLIDAAAEWMRQGLCHYRVRRQTEAKIELTLFSLDGQHTLSFDLWIQLRQFDRGRLALTFEGCDHLLDAQQRGIVRLPVAVEACIYVQHLICKRKNLRQSNVQHRLRTYAESLRTIRELALSRSMQQSTEEFVIPGHIEHATLQSLRHHVHLVDAPRGLMTRLKTAWHQRLAASRHASMISVMGCDGAGKTTLAEALAGDHPQEIRVLTGKHLYRKSLTYKLAVIFLRPLITRSRERFDEHLAPCLYVMAAFRLRMKILFATTGVTLVDRSLVDFLYVDRKTDQPSFVTRWIMNFLGCRVPTIHCHVAFENVMKRKQEMTAAGHAAYDKDMREVFVHQSPTDYIGFNNDQTLGDAQAAMRHLLMKLAPGRLTTETVNATLQKASSDGTNHAPQRRAG